MSGDLALIVPSRGRPHSAARLIKAVRETAAEQTHIYFALDADDPALDLYQQVFRELAFSGQAVIGLRDGLTGWTNALAVPLATKYNFLGSFGDDHVPVTYEWDARLMDAIRLMPGGVGYAYAEGGREGVPEGVVMSSAIVRALGWMALPSLRHFCIDHVWLDLGKAAGCITYLPDVRVDHLHHTAGKSALDETYAQAIHDNGEDIHEYGRWQESGFERDLATLKNLIEERS